jgi:hypothetical protein
MRSFEQINLNQFSRRFFLKRWLRLSRASGRDELLLIRISCRLTAWRGAAFDYCRNHRMIARKIWTLPNVVQQAAPENVSMRGLQEWCSIVRSNRDITGRFLIRRRSREPPAHTL